MILEVILLSALALYLFYYWATINNDFFEKRGIPYQKPFPLFGSMKDMVFRKKSSIDIFKDLYNLHDGRVFGVFDQRLPRYLIRDPELIKQILVKDFDHFINHLDQFGDDKNDLFTNSLFSMRDAKWKEMRSTLSPAFTGKKMRQMFELMNQVASDAMKHLKKLEEKEGVGKGIEIDLKAFCRRFTNDIIASTAFGLQINSFEDVDNQFYRMGKEITNFSTWQSLKFLLYGNFKFIMKLLGLSIFDKKHTDYFMRLVLDAMNYRQAHKIFRPDMINMLMEAKGVAIEGTGSSLKSHTREWTDAEIVAQCFLFFFAGFENSAALMCFAAHELMENPDIQQRLFEEIEEVESGLNGKELSYEELQSMKYMDAVVNEVLRKWPFALALDRVCNKDYSYTFDDGERFEMKSGECLWIPVGGFHLDPKYFPNPEKFDPDRFSDENKNNIVPFTYMPFGLGPRNCIASRFAQLEAKAMIYYFVKEFHIVAAKKSCIPLKMSPKTGFQLAPENGFWLKFTSRVPAA